MELEELQATWAHMSAQLERQHKLTDKIIMQMAQDRYSKKFQNISIFESIGALICFCAAIYILLNFGKLDTWYLASCGIFTLLFLIVLPILVLRAINQIKHLDILKYDYTRTLVNYLKAKKRLLLLQQLSSYLSLIQLFAVAAVFAKLWANKDFFMTDRDIWAYLAIAGSVLFIFFLARLGYKGYTKITSSAEEILKELDET